MSTFRAGRSNLPLSPSSIQVDTKLELPDLRQGHELYSVLSSALRSRAPLERENGGGSQACWPAKHFNLDQVALFRDGSEEEKAKILEGCGQDVLEEAYCIEKYGMHFAARMSLLSESSQEQMLYCLFASDEALHFSWISGYVSADRVAEVFENPFIKLLNEILQSAEKLNLTYLVQVILEGWGISHYHTLKDCNDAGLNRVFDRIIKDEARHHATGLILFNEQKPSAIQIKTVVEMMSRLLFLVQAGPQSVVSRIERVKGHLSRAQKITVFEELQCESETARKLGTLKGLVRSAGSGEEIFEKLDRLGAFKAYSAFECAELSS